MSSPVVVEYSAIAPTPWKNGRGITRNLFDDADPAGEWTFRISIAEITGTQPYSPYPGVRRGQAALGPGAVDLRIDGRAVALEPEDVIFFDGEDIVDATPRAEGFLDLNVMARRDAWTADVRVVTDPDPEVQEGDILVLIALHDDCTVDGRALHRLDSVRLAAAAPAVAGRFMLARLSPLPN